MGQSLCSPSIPMQGLYLMACLCSIETQMNSNPVIAMVDYTAPPFHDYASGGSAPKTPNESLEVCAIDEALIRERKGYILC
eukprot:1139702-Pelagomonas_calceolata.AAC.3